MESILREESPVRTEYRASDDSPEISNRRKNDNIKVEIQNESNPKFKKIEKLVDYFNT